MTKEIDCRGLACPAPVLQTKKSIEKEHPGVIKMVVDKGVRGVLGDVPYFPVFSFIVFWPFMASSATRALKSLV